MQENNVQVNSKDDTPDLPWEDSEKDSFNNLEDQDDWSDAPASSISPIDGEERAKSALKSHIVAIARTAKEGAARLEEIRSSIDDLVARARAIRQHGLNEFPEYIEKVVNGKPTIINMSTDRNRWKAFVLLFGEAEQRPFYNEFTRMRTDGLGNEIDNQYQVVDLVEAMGELNLLGQSAETVRKALVEWALLVHRDPLKERIKEKMPEWDGVPRMETSMMDLFECFDTPLNRLFGQYFWLSLYGRAMGMGVQAEIALSLFGAQDCGKSYFTQMICEELVGEIKQGGTWEKAKQIPLDMGGNIKDFLRAITGQSVIANIPEMTGFGRSDLNKMKAFMAAQSDNFDFKWEGNKTLARRWIVVMDGNEYSGLQRDETGNRRFYPVFCGQVESEESNGEPTWKEAPYQCPVVSRNEDGRNGFRDTVWQLMAEAAHFFESGGVRAYDKVRGDTSKAVQAFSQEEMANGRGAVEDPVIKTYLSKAIARALHCGWNDDAAAKAARSEESKFVPNVYIKRGRMNNKTGKKSPGGLTIREDYMLDQLKFVSGDKNTNVQRLKKKLAAFGATYVENIQKGINGYVWEGKERAELMDEYPWSDVPDDAADVHGGF